MKKNISTNEIRKLWLDFFKNNNHLEVESQSLIPKNDNSLLWINSGVATLKKFFSGQENPPSNRIVNSQRCIRTNDIENVGLTSRHHTFFEMLGNFSIGDYFRKEAIELAAKFLLEVLEINPSLLYITVYEEDNESFDLWIKNGMLKEHIIKCSKERNFWEIGKGPCGPCTEIYFDRGEKFDPNKIGERLFFEDIENDRYIEIWNIVFSEFENDGNNNYTKLARQNIDTGAGLERLACIIQDANTNYDTDGFVAPRKVLEANSVYKYNQDLYFEAEKDAKQLFVNKSFTVIIDHLKACLFAIADGAIPSNKDRGYVLRKLLRRLFFHLDFLKIKKDVLNSVVTSLIDLNSEYYSYLVEQKNNVLNVLYKEYDGYKLAIKNSLNFLQGIIANNEFNEFSLFKLVETYGFPIEIINELALSNDEKLKQEIFDCALDNQIQLDVKNISIDINKFNVFFDEHKKVSKADKKIDGIEKQNVSLMALDLPSSFDYFASEFSDAKVIKIFNENFEEVDALNCENGYLVLDKTCMYATSGGQLNDTGTINGFLVDDVIKSPNGIHVHHVINATIKTDDKCLVKHDTTRRQKLRIHHTSEHLLHSALKNEISTSIKQEGALKAPDKFTFDFFYPNKLSYDEFFKIEKNIKNVIELGFQTETTLCSLKEAQDLGALAYFEDVYKKIKGDLRVVKVSDQSIEICGGTHVENTSEIFDFKIIGFTSKGSGSWRIEAISGHDNVTHFNETILKSAMLEFLDNKKFLEKEDNDIDDEIKALLETDVLKIHYLQLKYILEKLKNAILIVKNKNKKNELAKKAQEIKETLIGQKDLFFEKVIHLEGYDRKVLITSLMDVINEVPNKLFFVTNFVDNSYQYIFVCNEQLAKQKNINFNLVAKKINEQLEGKGGGRNNYVQGSIKQFNHELIVQLISEFVNGIN